MATLEFLLAAVLDPVQAALVLVVVLAYRGPLPIAVAAAVAAVASETIMLLAAPDYTWGELLAPRLVSSFLQAAVLRWVVGLAWPSRTGGHPRPRGESTPTGASRLAPWHMRAFVRRRLTRLR